MRPLRSCCNNALDGLKRRFRIVPIQWLLSLLAGASALRFQVIEKGLQKRTHDARHREWSTCSFNDLLLASSPPCIPASRWLSDRRGDCAVDGMMQSKNSFMTDQSSMEPFCSNSCGHVCYVNYSIGRSQLTAHRHKAQSSIESWTAPYMCLLPREGDQHKPSNGLAARLGLGVMRWQIRCRL